MKKLSTLSAVMFCMMMNAQYCMPSFQYGADSNMITNVSFGTINNTSPSQSGTTQAYENFTYKSTDIKAGNSYQISVKGPSSTFPSDVVVFIDFNKNGSFDDAGESFNIGRLEAANPFNAMTITATIAVPANTTLGVTRMRVLKNTNTAAYSNPNAANSISTACDTGLRAGQAEDYTLNILASNLATSEVTKKATAKIYPNPTSGSVDVKTEEGLEKYEIYSLSGQKLIEGKSAVVSMDSLTPGTYLIRIYTKDKKTITEKIIKK
ncbi:putative secreted protein (Por secretion system target) [Chryseobacterium sp. 52]|uniref:T9SS type A sorting domain-containing protein n=1 Tax=Chryseobacterium sp. 52 TaxID=2035213 RepID=UPI000C18A39C|nr:T9SS type A sorting domain-containing protein [Chryseobacterium sp. 52]PIF45669.1 putative secreted protein (Por secretion system target) [Chryseobacterium sp. 52]